MHDWRLSSSSSFLRFGSDCFLLEVWWLLKHHYSYLHLRHPTHPNCLLSVFLVKKMVDGYITVGHKSPSCVIHVLLNVSQPCNSSVQVNSSHCVLIMCKPFLQHLCTNRVPYMNSYCVNMTMTMLDQTSI